MPNSITSRPCGGMDDARGFGGDQGFERDGGEQIGLRDLTFDQRSADVHHGLPLVEHGAFGDGENVAGEAEVREVVPESRRARCGSLRGSAQILDFFGVETRLQQVVDGAMQSGERARNRDSAAGAGW